MDSVRERDVIWCGRTVVNIMNIFYHPRLVPVLSRKTRLHILPVLGTFRPSDVEYHLHRVHTIWWIAMPAPHPRSSIGRNIVTVQLI